MENQRKLFGFIISGTNKEQIEITDFKKAKK